MNTQTRRGPDLSSHYLEKLGEHHFYMRLPDTLLESVELAELAGRLIITGDLCPGLHGVIATSRRYGLAWFAKATTPGYLAEKLMPPAAWYPERALRELRELAEGRDFLGTELTPEQVEMVVAVEGGVESGGAGSHAVYDLMGELGIEEHVPGWGQDPRDMRVLVAIQRRFAELYEDRQ